MTAPPKIQGLGEIAIRCHDLAAMVAFYRDVVGLELLSDRGNGIVFFRVAAGYGGHTTVLALFQDPENRSAGTARACIIWRFRWIGTRRMICAVGWTNRTCPGG